MKSEKVAFVSSIISTFEKTFSGKKNWAEERYYRQ